MTASSWIPIVVPGGMAATPRIGALAPTGRPATLAASRHAVPGAATGPCFVAGTRIAVPGGTVRVESLRPGDLVLTLLGERRPVAWSGQRSLSVPGRPGATLAVRIAAHAFGRGMPERDLLLAPGHAVFVEGVLAPVAALVNEATVRREPGSERLRCVHLALETHDVLLAEDMPVESCLGRPAVPASLPQGQGIVMLHPRPDAGTAPQLEVRCAPLAWGGVGLARVRARLAREAGRLIPAGLYGDL